ncbi:MAG: TRAP transporter permease [Sphaerochaetaceae bacterium]
MEQHKKFSLSKINSLLILGLSTYITLFHIFITISTNISVMQQRVIHMFTLMIVWFLLKMGRKNQSKKANIFNFLSAAVVTIIFIYFLLNTRPTVLMEKGIWGITVADSIIGVILILFILEVSRETIGMALPIIAIVFLLYALLGPMLPKIIAHRGYDFSYITSYVAWTNEGIYGTPIGAAVSFVVLYIIFGELLEKFGAGKFFIDLSYALTGRMRGGPAEAAVLSSALMGSINGSAVANVVTTGTFTIPLMKKTGYSAEYAGAVEAVASTGGQILPPVMGAAAFVMADMTGIAYSTIIIAALIPGLLYYISLALTVYFQAGKQGIKPSEDARFLRARDILKKGYYHLIPLAVLIVFLIGFGFSASYSAIYAILSILIIGIIQSLYHEKKFPLDKLKEVVINTAKSTVPVSSACASAGIVIGIVSMTGLGVRFTQIVFQLAQGQLFPMLLMIMVACIVLGMGLPSTAAYVIAATVAAPALLKVGIDPLSANLFVFYFAIISFITPPVALAAYAASGIANSNTNKTGFLAFRLGFSGFIIPFLFVYYPALLIVGTSVTATLYALLLALLAVILIAASFEGWFGINIPTILRWVMIVVVILIVLPYSWSDILGLIIAAAIFTYLLVMFKKGQKTEN